MATIQNPILPGFHPDPSILRVGGDYYIVTSTFEWFPGLSIYHSTDLVNWTLIARPLNRLSQLDMRGEPDSCGVWAPCLSYNDGTFYLCYTDVKRFGGDYKDTHNYIATTTDIKGEWSDPIYVNSSGFDPSLFFDDDGKAWFLNMIWDHRPVRGRNNWTPNSYFAGIMLQEFDLDSESLVGEAKNITPGTSIGLSEGPHLYRRNGKYYLLLAEGGTGKDHACSFLRSDNIDGPYEVDPQGPIVTAAMYPTAELKRTGHGDWVETPEGDCYLVHLSSRPIPHRGRSVMGRETSMQPIYWTEDGWPRLKGEGSKPIYSFDLGDAPTPTTDNSQLVDFATQQLPLDFQSLRFPLPESTLTYADRPGFLRLYGKESIGSLFHSALVARRQQAFKFSASTKLEFSPTHFQQMAGLTCYYNSKKFYYLHVTTDDEGNRVIDVSMCLGDMFAKYPLAEPISVPKDGAIELRATVDFDQLYFAYRLEGQDSWTDLGLRLDYSILCDEIGDGGADANFTGAFVGICCQDVAGTSLHADFAYFDYQESGD